MACEYLKITTQEREILTGASTKHAYQFFGYTNGNTWRSNLAKVPEFLRRTGVTYLDLVELLKTRYINAELTGQVVDHQHISTSSNRLEHAQTPAPNAVTGTAKSQSVKPHKDSDNIPDWQRDAITDGDDPEPLFSPKTIVLYAPNSVCDLSQTRIQHLDLTKLEDGEWLKMHRFLRLWKKLDWKMPELDRAMKALNATDINDDFLENLSDLKWLQTELNVPVVKLLSLWAPIDTFGQDALYLKLFQNKAVINPVDSAFQLLQDDSSRLKSTDATISEHIPPILAALRINDEDLLVIRDATELAQAGALLTLENLSLLYRHALLAKALKLKVKDFISLKLLTGINPFHPGKLAETVKFVKKARSVKESGFSIAHLNYLFRHDFDSDKNIAPRDEAVMLLLDTLQADLNKILDETIVFPDPTGELLRSKLSLVMDSTLVDGAMGLIDGTSKMDDKQGFVRQHFQLFLKQEEIEEAVLLLEGSDITQEQREANIRYLLPRLMTHLRDSLSRTLVKQTISESLELDGELAKALLERILTAKTDATKTAMADFLALVGDGLAVTHFTDVNLGTVQHWAGLIIPQHDDNYSFYTRLKGGVKLWVNNEVLINQWVAQDKTVEHTSENQIPLKAGQAYRMRLEYFTNDPETVTELRWSSVSTPKNIVPQSQLYSAVSFPIEGIKQAYLRLHKIALLANTFEMTAEEAIYLAEHSEDFEDFDFNSVPTDSSAQNVMDGIVVKYFEQWEELHEYFTLRTSLPQRDLSLLDVFTAANFPQPPNDPILSSAVPPMLAMLTAWPLTDIRYLVGPDALDLSVDAFKNASGPTKLWEVFTLSRKLGVSVQQLRDWAVKHSSSAQANAIVQAVKAKHDDDQWLVIAKPLNDSLREKQKAALIAYVLADKAIVEKGITDSNQLFEYFLIDVNMSACFMTSRIKQAISSVHLFVQRCLMNLEPDVSAALLDSEWWKWMKNYRVWEANRKVFLYPENWIEPDLRDDKSQFFKELETQLLQDEVTEHTVEEALLAYLEKLDDVARLEICGVYRYDAEHSGEDKTVGVHIFGRTKNDPPNYYYRRFIPTTGVWTSWEQVNHVEGQHLIPVIYNRRLHLFWATFEEQPDPATDLSLVPIRSLEEIQYEQEYDAYLRSLDTWNREKRKHENEQKEKLKDITVKGDCYPVWTPIAVTWHCEDDIIIPGYDIGDYSVAEPTKPEEPDLTKDAKEPRKRWAIKLSWIEYRETGWSAKRTAKDCLYSPGEEIRDYGFQSAINAKGQLSILCYRRLPEYTEAVEDLDVISKVGWFVMNGCRQEVLAKDRGFYESFSDPLDSIKTPARSRVSFMRFDQESGNTLTFYGWNPFHDRYAILQNTPSAFRLVHPPYDTDPQESSFAGSIYPFVYEDDRVNYFAMPTPAIPPQAQGEIKHPSVDIYVEEEDALAAKVRLPDMGDPAPMERRTKFDSHRIGESETLSAARSQSPVSASMAMQRSQGPREVSEIEMVMTKKSSKSGQPKVEMAEKNFGPISIYLKFYTFFHPHVCEMIAALHRRGIPGLLNLANQKRNNDYVPGWVFDTLYKPTEKVHWKYPSEDVDFNGGAYSIYNWELFFHAPLLIADRLSKNQHFEEAQQWLHYIFDPTDSDTEEPSPARYWKVLPFYQNKDIVRLDKWLESVSTKEVEEWRNNPFSPHLVARSRLVSYQKMVVMKYIDNLIAWGDQLFGRDTIESINEATQLYIMAYNCLGPRVQEIPQRGKVKEQTYHGLEKQGLDAFSNAIVELENEFPFSSNDQELISKKLPVSHFKENFSQPLLGGISNQKKQQSCITWSDNSCA